MDKVSDIFEEHNVSIFMVEVLRMDERWLIQGTVGKGQCGGSLCPWNVRNFFHHSLVSQLRL